MKKVLSQEEVAQAVKLHAMWVRGEPGGVRAVFMNVDLTGANLTDADLTRADLTRADLTGADLTGADLTGADLTRADLTGADLTGADLTRANLTGSCLDPVLNALARAFCKACPPVGKHGGRIVYRTAISQHVGGTVYEPGKIYQAPWLSWSCETDCHPGIYAASLDWMKEHYGSHKLVKCYVRDGDWVISAKGAVRCKRIMVLEYVK